MPPLRFFRSQLAQHEAPAVTYYIRGTSSNVGGTETFNIQFIDDGALFPSASETITCNVDANGDWEFSYRRKKIYSLKEFAQNNTTILSADFTDADDFSQMVSLYAAFDWAENITTIVFKQNSLSHVTTTERVFNHAHSLANCDLTNETFAALQDAFAMFNECRAMTAINLHSATFDALTSMRQMFSNNPNLESVSVPNAQFHLVTNVTSVFITCPKLKTIDLHSALFDAQLSVQSMFHNLPKLESVDLSNATFANATSARNFFDETRAMVSLSLPKATFANITDAYGMFTHNGGILATLNLPEATFDKVTTAFGMFINPSLVTLNIPKATFRVVSNTNYMWADVKMLTTLNVQEVGTFPISFSFTRSNSGQSMTYQSILNVANWVKDLTGLSAQTVTFNASAWNALTAAEQSNIDTILSGKNWTRAIA